MSDPSQGTLEVESLVLSESDGVLWVMECQGPFLFRDVPSLFVIIQNLPYLRIPWSHLSSPPLDLNHRRNMVSGNWAFLTALGRVILFGSHLLINKVRLVNCRIIKRDGYHL